MSSASSSPTPRQRHGRPATLCSEAPTWLVHAQANPRLPRVITTASVSTSVFLKSNESYGPAGIFKSSLTRKFHFGLIGMFFFITPIRFHHLCDRFIEI